MLGEQFPTSGHEAADVDFRLVTLTEKLEPLLITHQDVVVKADKFCAGIPFNVFSHLTDNTVDRFETVVSTMIRKNRANCIIAAVSALIGTPTGSHEENYVLDREFVITVHRMNIMHRRRQST